jgi:multisubunit Na+/H+ antiporter MnhC subunit
MANIYAPVMRALVVVALVLATATLMFVTVNTARAARDAQFSAPYSSN